MLEYNEMKTEIINEVKRRNHSNKAIILIDEREIHGMEKTRHLMSC